LTTADPTSTVETQYKKDVLADVTETLKSSSSMSGTISGSFNKTFATDGNTNDVTVNGIGTDAAIVAGTSSFDADIAKNGAKDASGNPVNSGAGTASGGASGSVGTTATANANSSQFVSSFAQAY